MDIDPLLLAQLKAMCAELDRRTDRAELLERYKDGDHPIPRIVTESRATNAYRTIMELADTNWPQLIVDSVEERLEVQGLRIGDAETSKRIWDVWQENGLDADSSLAHDSALTTGRAFAIVWPGDTGSLPSITPEHTSTCIVQYATGSRRRRVAALRRWREGDDWFATMYLPTAVYKFQMLKQAGGIGIAPGEWEARETPNESWPLANPFAPFIPVVELAVNRDLRPSVYGRAYGEFEKNTGHIDRINFATFSQIVAMTWSGFPIRALIGDPIMRDDDDNALAPFDLRADSIVQIENPDGKLIQLPEASLENYGTTIDRYVHQLAAITKTPAHYLLGQLVNISADAIRASEAGLVSKVRRHRRSLGESWEDVARLVAFAMDIKGPVLSDAEVLWADAESRSLAERADAAVKLHDILPWQALASKVLGATPQEIVEWETMKATDGLMNVLTAPAAPPVA